MRSLKPHPNIVQPLGVCESTLAATKTATLPPSPTPSLVCNQPCRHLDDWQCAVPNYSCNAALPPASTAWSRVPNARRCVGGHGAVRARVGGQGREGLGPCRPCRSSRDRQEHHKLSHPSVCCPAVAPAAIPPHVHVQICCAFSLSATSHVVDVVSSRQLKDKQRLLSPCAICACVAGDISDRSHASPTVDPPGHSTRERPRRWAGCVTAPACCRLLAMDVPCFQILLILPISGETLTTVLACSLFSVCVDVCVCVCVCVCMCVCVCVCVCVCGRSLGGQVG